MTRVLPRVGSLDDTVEKGPWVYLAITSQGPDATPQGLRVVVDTKTRARALELGRGHFSRLTLQEGGCHYKAVILQDWAYTAAESEFLQFTTTEKTTVNKGDLTVTEMRRVTRGKG